MGYSNSIIAIKGNYLDRAATIFEAFGYHLTDEEKQFNDRSEALNYLFENYFDLTAENIALRGFWENNGWTIICDPEMVDPLEGEKISTLSQKLDTVILTFIIQDTSASYFFAKYDQSKQRIFFSIGCEIMEDEGVALPEEKGLQINENVGATDILNLAKRFGIDLVKSGDVTLYTVKELEYGEIMKEELTQISEEMDKRTFAEKKETAKDKPWWRFW